VDGVETEADGKASVQLLSRGAPKKLAAGKIPAKVPAKTPAKVNGKATNGTKRAARSDASSDGTSVERSVARSGDEESALLDSDYSEEEDLGPISEGDEGDGDGMVDEDGINQEKICCA
jgi:hypothetical protein